MSEWYCMFCKRAPDEISYDDNDIAHCGWCGRGLIVAKVLKMNDSYRGDQSTQIDYLTAIIKVRDERISALEDEDIKREAWYQAAVKRIAELEEAQRWRKTTTEPPTFSDSMKGLVLVCYPYSNHFVTSGDRKITHWEQVVAFPETYPLWMPIPAPPEEQWEYE